MQYKEIIKDNDKIKSFLKYKNEEIISLLLLDKDVNPKYSIYPKP